MTAPTIIFQKAFIKINKAPDINGIASLLEPLTLSSITSQVDGFLNPDPNRFELDASSGIIYDPLTGLMWGDETDELTPDEAMEACKASRQGGHSDWTKAGLRPWLTIVDYTRNNPVLPPPFKTHGDSVWTADETPWSKKEKRTGSSRSFFYVGMCYGNVNYYLAGYRRRARPVRRAAPASQCLVIGQ
ncbi:hypothetical protein DyAD56_16065 [Dyella sp. AD56]|uniref:Lcl C-terminal domain-containing protein n=1 Tax=Dyella sp. AD56 TaxID=1528744 RepID=UPI000C82BC03|nr:DUF1566 domain-containing protein [Dyella sp. AD56]PMQ04204.1 hypothetical protein DyAD56_16065 [Dyella sp. AD56]